MGFAQWDIGTPVTKGTNAVLALSKTFNKVTSLPYSCLHCGKCVTVCPMHLMPLYLAQFSANEDKDMCEKFNVMSCVECGSCAYTCPGQVPRVQLIRKMKNRINDERRAQAAAQAAAAAQAEKPKEENKGGNKV